LLKAWLLGDWTIARGAYFAAVLEESRNAVANWNGKIPKGWRTYLAHDFGSSAPSVTYVVVKSPGGTGPDGQFYPRGSLVLVDELATNEPGNVSKGMGYTVPVLAEHIKDMCKHWKVKPHGVADDAIFAKSGHGAGSISDEFRAAGVTFLPAKKADRITGWNVMRRLLQDAGKPDVPGLYIARHCEYFFASVPYLGRDPRRPGGGRSTHRSSCQRGRPEPRPEQALATRQSVAHQWQPDRPMKSRHRAPRPPCRCCVRYAPCPAEWL